MTMRRVLEPCSPARLLCVPVSVSAQAKSDGDAVEPMPNPPAIRPPPTGRTSHWPHLEMCSYVRNLTAELGTMRRQFAPLPFIIPRMPSVRAMCTSPCASMHAACVLAARGNSWAMLLGRAPTEGVCACVRAHARARPTQRLTCHVLRYTLSLPCTCIRILSLSSGATAVRELRVGRGREQEALCDVRPCQHACGGVAVRVLACRAALLQRRATTPPAACRPPRLRLRTWHAGPACVHAPNGEQVCHPRPTHMPPASPPAMRLFPMVGHVGRATRTGWLAQGTAGGLVAASTGCAIRTAVCGLLAWGPH